jgi:hypothetical protein
MLLDDWLDILVGRFAEYELFCYRDAVASSQSLCIHDSDPEGREKSPISTGILL